MSVKKPSCFLGGEREMVMKRERRSGKDKT
jgi:hypothetical protein